MRNLVKLLALGSLVIVPLSAGCGDDSDSDVNNGSGASGGSAGSGGKASGGSAGKASGGDGATGNMGSGGDGATGSGGDGATGNMGGVGGSDPGPDCDLDALEDGGDLPASGDVAGGFRYTIAGRTDIVDGDTLTIGACTVIEGNAQDDVIVVQPGGQIVAEGTANAPIVFTSGAASPEPGDWGGLVILGNGVCNDATDDEKCEVEGFASDPPLYGNTEANAVDDESSGSLKYVRIEYSGVDLGLGSEINGLTLAGVGSGTTISHVMVRHTQDDCFEWFGGAASADHLIAYNCGDDMFDTDAGWSGRVQFAFGRQLDTLTDDPNGFEMDNDSTDATKEPVSSPKFSNVTLCGTGVAASGSPKNGMVLRRGTGGALMNVLITGFETAAFSVRETPDTAITLVDSTQWDNGAEFDGSHTGGSDWFSAQDGNSSTAPEDFGDCFADPPAPFPAATIAGGTPTGFGDEAAEFQGAFADADDNWMDGAWVAWD